MIREIESSIKNHNSKTIFRLTILCLLSTIVNAYFFNYLNDTLLHFTIVTHISDFSKKEHFFLAIIFAPVVESYILQVIPNRVLIKLNVYNKVLLIILPSILFGILHSYHWYYMIMMFFFGIIINFYYIECKELTKYAFWFVALLHALYNLYGFLFISS